MGMIAEFIQLSPSLLRKLMDDPSVMEAIEVEELDHENLKGEEFGRLDIDKAWHGIHFLLTGDPDEGIPPIGSVIYDGMDLPNDVYEDLRYLTPEEVKEVSAALSQVTPEEFKRRYDPEAMGKANIYPNVWIEEGEEALDYLLGFYDELQQFYESAAREGKAILLSTLVSGKRRDIRKVSG